VVENSGDAEEVQRAGGREVVVMKMGWPCWVGVVTEDLEVQRRFYRDMLGLVELAAGPGLDPVRFRRAAGGILAL